MSLGDINPPTEQSRSMFVLKQSANIYTAMMILAFVFIVIGCLFLFLELKAYDLSIHVSPDAKVSQVMRVPVLESGLAAAEQICRFMDVPVC